MKKEISWDHKRHETNGITPVCKNNKWGAINKQGHVVVSPKWDFISWATRHNQVIVMQDGKFGVIDLDGNYIIPLGWDHITFPSVFGCPPFDQGDFFEIRSLKNPVPLSSCYDDRRYELANRECWNGLIDYRGTIIVEPKYDCISSIYDGGIVEIKKDNQWGAVNVIARSILFEPMYEGLIPSQNGFFWMRKGSHKWGIINSSNQVICKPQWAGISGYRGSRYYRANRYGGWGVLQYDGKCVVDFIWDDVRINGEHFQGKKNKKWHIIDDPMTPQ